MASCLQRPTLLLRPTLISSLLPTASASSAHVHFSLCAGLPLRASPSASSPAPLHPAPTTTASIRNPPASSTFPLIGRKSLSMAASAQSRTDIPNKESDKCFEIPSGKTPLEMIYLEGNSWLWTVNGLNILVDPVLVGNLDFGIPFLYDAAKKSKLMKEFTLDDLPKLDCILITQGYDDHCHKNTLTAMVERFSEVRVIASPNCEPIMGKIGYHNVTYLEPSDGTMLGDIRIRAIAGPVLGPPWQRPENGYFLEVPDPKFVLYYEPHCIFGKAGLENERADVIVTPVNKQVLPAYTLVSGQEDAVRLAKLLQPKFLVTMKNAELDSRGVLSLIVSEKGTVDTFKKMLAEDVPNCQVLEPEPGVPLEVPVLNVDRNSSN
ncbi:hypothetical protein M758_7G187300 [Ceratodon purpureus]|uniref:Metallo-beta-lactamase domain-containing protein n=1 Tax=Ceratodon purpureus TaxID=3225 RepID=A0A8T0H9Q5_CERPU|nr:hypothetical protein KC19_7G190600 [Ceratodon purpureus]KAG0612060.1 hypothetical protein M758_7G187300 [Ceratodon purpureus]